LELGVPGGTAIPEALTGPGRVDVVVAEGRVAGPDETEGALLVAPQQDLVHPEDQAQGFLVQAFVLLLPSCSAGRVQEKVEAPEHRPQLVVAEQTDRFPAIRQAVGAAGACSGPVLGCGRDHERVGQDRRNRAPGCLDVVLGHSQDGSAGCRYG
jgi:hypothetical protein